MNKYFWLVFHRKNSLAHDVGVWKLANIAGVHESKKLAQEIADHFEDESIGWEYKVVRYKKG
jgi:hypothetical protein